jgi:protein SCO1/2
MKAGNTVLTFVLIASSLPARYARAQVADTGITSKVGFDQKLGAQVPLDLLLEDENGQQIRFGDFLRGRPVVLALVYYRCPLLCTQVLNGLTRSLKALRLNPGTDFDVVAVSIDPDEAPELASRKKEAYLERFDRPGTESGWHFLVGQTGPIAQLASAVGFRYQYNTQTKLYAHAAGIVILTTDGRVARYFFGIDYPPKELQNELERAAAGRVGPATRRLLLLCYDYDAAAGKYTLSIVRIIRILGTTTVLSLGMFLLLMFRRERWQKFCQGSSHPAERVGVTHGVVSRH